MERRFFAMLDGNRVPASDGTFDRKQLLEFVTAVSMTKPTVNAKLAREILIARQQESQRRFVFGYSGAANG